MNGSDDSRDADVAPDDEREASLEFLIADARDGSPAPELRARVLEAAVFEGRFDRFSGPVAALLGVSEERAAELLDRMQAERGWMPIGTSGMVVRPVPVGPMLERCVGTFARVPSGSRLPDHEHFGVERTLVLQGTCIDRPDDAVYRPGDFIAKAAGTSHSVDARRGPDLLILSVIEHGFAMGSMIFGRRP